MVAPARPFNVRVGNRGFIWRCVGALEDGQVRLAEVFFVRNGEEARVLGDSLACMRMDELLSKRIKEALRC